MVKRVLKYPVGFSFLMAFVFLLLLSGSYVLGNHFESKQMDRYWGEFIGNVFISIIFIVLLQQFRWLDHSGIFQTGSKKKWLALLIPILYGIGSTTWAYTGTLGINSTAFLNESPLFLNMMAIGVSEEIVFRGIIFTCFVLAWQNKHNGIMRAGILSALIFGLLHMVHVFMGKDPVLGSLQSLAAAFSGIFYAGMLVYTRSLWPAILAHGLTNAMVYLAILNIPDFKESLNSNLLDVVMAVPLLLLGVYLLLKHQQKNTYGK